MCGLNSMTVCRVQCVVYSMCVVCSVWCGTCVDHHPLPIWCPGMPCTTSVKPQTMKVLGTTYKGEWCMPCIAIHEFNLICVRVLKGKSLCEWPGLQEFCEELTSKGICSPFLLSLRVDIYEEEAKKDSSTAQEKIGIAVEVRMCSLIGNNLSVHAFLFCSCVTNSLASMIPFESIIGTIFLPSFKRCLWLRCLRFDQ